MRTVQINGVPKETLAVLRQRATEAHQSLQAYLLALLERAVSMPNVDDVRERAGHRTGGQLSFARATRLLLADRERH